MTIKQLTDDLLQQLKTEYKSKTLYVLPVDEDIKGDLKRLSLSEEDKLLLHFEEGTSSLYFDETSKDIQRKIKKLREAQHEH